uniref:RING-type domain-containing protein n=1 Tax=Neobodo designis TaxID=312471 RepID=A0A7S1R194_NEODS|mmetsp:Transcript_6346/g.19969  ORF Transcript_6346/g.19969 Transcript_6346/m.19969 type:complete len:177 (+) Transcript_6346:88-618(+)|eukprot:CAMPEP_0174828720 /NCGR_PEP_ID=MMETSP1114-20130205/1503_1 /TAXON_ID=312471 /ORGANISM="Neobodo designis, Strain CCAP 1951/1" /LENGTH=176 /DNA_ID=CAMNT_0016062445 /DNA_START=87 /DNA_END=617 /DNA_ORIENTATION=-
MYNYSVTGSWRCLGCGHVTDAQPAPTDDNDLVALPLTAGQREERWCPPCSGMKVHELQAKSRGQLNADSARHAAPAAAAPSSVAAPVQAQPVAATVVPTSGAVDVSQLTDEALDALAAAVAKEQQARRLCVVCSEGAKEVIFYPCKHQCCCRACAGKCAACPMCRGQIQDRIVAFR